MSSSGLDPRIARGTARMLESQRAMVTAGGGRLGWKAGFGAPAAMEMLGIDRPLVGYLSRELLLASGATVDMSDWVKPVLEAEVAVRLGRDLGAGASPAEALAAVDGWAVAIELADADPPPTDVEEIIAGNIFHRHVLLGPWGAERPASTSFVVRRDGDEVATTDDPEALTGELGVVLASMADTLAACGDRMQAGDVIITGSVVPPLPLGAGLWQIGAAAFGRLEVTVR